MIEFAEELGLIIRLSNSKCLFTPRWRSFIRWLRRLNNLRSEELAQELPVKFIKYDKEKASFKKNLYKFFESDELTKMFEKELDLLLMDAAISYTDFAEKFGHLITLLKPLLQPESIAGLSDTVLLSCCRAGYIPLEHLFRAYQPYELHLLIQALNWEKSSDRDWGRSPISLGFATIAGRVERDSKLSNASQMEQDATTSNFDNWLAPYRSLFSTLNADISLPVVRGDSEQTGAQNQQRYFAHQTVDLLDTIWLDPKLNELNFQSGFALWLIRIQAKEVWGSLPIDPRESIPDVFPNSDAFPKWDSLDKKQTVLRLVNLGLWGGIMRANKPRKGGGIEAHDYLLSTHAVLLRAKGPDEAISQVRAEILPDEILSFSSTENTQLPQWVKTKAFAICFYHAMRQATYHALETFVLTDKKKKKDGEPCLLIRCDEQEISISNRGEVKEEHFDPDFATDDRMFFKNVMKKIDEFCEQNEITGKFEIDGPRPVKTSNIWELILRREG